MDPVPEKSSSSLILKFGATEALDRPSIFFVGLNKWPPSTLIASL